MTFEEKEISGFGKYPKAVSKVYKPQTVKEIIRNLNGSSVIARGLGRSYGDASLNADANVTDVTLLNNYISFDETNGILKCEVGVSFEDILDTFVHRGWFLPVTPGTKYITVGGAIASDVHGKNHHKEGSFSNFLLSFKILTADRNIIECSREHNSDLFWATIGGMGLTGIITEAEFKMRRIESPFITNKSVRAKNLESLFEEFEKHDNDYIYSVAWIDIVSRGNSFGRSVLYLGNHAARTNLPQKYLSQIETFKPKGKKSVPIEMPNFSVNKLSVTLFNTFYYMFHPSGDKIIDYDTYFYPLDSILNWNNIYGKRGFAQYQLVVPEENGREAITKALKIVTDYGGGSFLSVLKKMGAHTGILSFPIKGYTLSMDFGIRPGIHKMIDDLDKVVMDYGGRTYLTKDSFLNEEKFKNMYEDDWQKWIEIKRKYDSKNIFSSNLSRRIGLCP